MHVLIIIIVVLVIAAVVAFVVLQSSDVKRLSALESMLSSQGTQVTGDYTTISSKVDALTAQLAVQANQLAAQASQLASVSTIVPVTFQACSASGCSNCTQTNFTYIQVGNLVFLQIPQTNLGTCGGALKNTINITGTIPAALRPKQELFFPIIMYAGSSATSVRIFHALPSGAMEIVNTGGNPVGSFGGSATDPFQIWPTTISWAFM